MRAKFNKMVLSLWKQMLQIARDINYVSLLNNYITMEGKNGGNFAVLKYHNGF